MKYILLGLLFLIGCSEDPFNEIQTKDFQINVVQNGIVGIDLNTGAPASTDKAYDLNATIGPFYITREAESGIAHIEGSVLIYEPNIGFSGKDTIKLDQGKKDDVEYKHIKVYITIGHELEGPKIKGTPTTQIKIKTSYYFKPTLTDNPNKEHVFSITNKPYWLSFNSSNGALKGISPSFEQEYENIGIEASDGTRKSTLRPFNILVIDDTVDEENNTSKETNDNMDDNNSNTTTIIINNETIIDNNTETNTSENNSTENNSTENNTSK